MTPTEAVLLTRFVKAVIPAQKFDEFTADTWCEVLADLTLDECKAAVVALMGARPFVGPSDIRDHVQAVRLERLARFPVPEPPDAVADNPALYIEWLAAARRQIAETGEPLPEAGEPRAITAGGGDQ